MHNVKRISVTSANNTYRSLYTYIRRLDDINVQACACDSLHRDITKFSVLSIYIVQPGIQYMTKMYNVVTAVIQSENACN